MHQALAPRARSTSALWIGGGGGKGKEEGEEESAKGVCVCDVRSADGRLFSLLPLLPPKHFNHHNPGVQAT